LPLAFRLALGQQAGRGGALAAAAEGGYRVAAHGMHAANGNGAFHEAPRRIARWRKP
jgi:hypothetical protein